MRTYIVIRHGSNAANQSCCPRAAIGTVEASNKKEAERIATERWTFYNNQYCEVVPFSRARAEDRRVAQEEDVSDYQENQWLEEEAAYWNKVLAKKKKRKANAA